MHVCESHTTQTRGSAQWFRSFVRLVRALILGLQSVGTATLLSIVLRESPLRSWDRLLERARSFQVNEHPGPVTSSRPGRRSRCRRNEDPKVQRLSATSPPPRHRTYKGATRSSDPGQAALWIWSESVGARDIACRHLLIASRPLDGPRPALVHDTVAPLHADSAHHACRLREAVRRICVVGTDRPHELDSAFHGFSRVPVQRPAINIDLNRMPTGRRAGPPRQRTRDSSDRLNSCLLFG